MATKSKRRAAGDSVKRNLWGATNTFGAIWAPRKSVPRRIPASFRDFSDPVLLVTECTAGRHGIGHGAPVFNAINACLRSSLASHRGQWQGPVLCTLFAVREDRPCGSKATLHFFKVVRAQPRSLAAILRSNKSTTYRLSKSIRENVRKV